MVRGCGGSSDRHLSRVPDQPRRDQSPGRELSQDDSVGSRSFAGDYLIAAELSGRLGRRLAEFGVLIHGPSGRRYGMIDKQAIKRWCLGRGIGAFLFQYLDNAL
jgi:hypothetical protein